MEKIYFISGIMLLFMVLPLAVWASNPCMPIAQSCMNAGYYKGGNTVGKGLVENCVLPIVNHQKTLPNTNFGEDSLRRCKILVMEKMKSEMGHH